MQIDNYVKEKALASHDRNLFDSEHVAPRGFLGRDIIRFLAVDVILVLCLKLLIGLGVFSSVNMYIITILASKLLLLFYLLWLVQSRSRGWLATGSGSVGRWWGWPVALILYAAAYPVLLWLSRANDRIMALVYSLAGWQYAPQPQDVVALIFNDSGLIADSLRLVLVGFAVLIGPWMEELAFRGVGLDGFRKGGGLFSAVIWVGILFGMYHFSLNLLLPLSALGILFGVMRVISGSLWCSTFCHCLHNSLALAVTSYELGWLDNYRSFFNFF